MKVVLFCGGLGLRLRSPTIKAPKPMVVVGALPLLVHLMRYYARFGHDDFLLCLGHHGEVIQRYFEGPEGRALQEGPNAWRVTCVDTGLESSVGERLWSVRDALASEPMFLANYADGLADAPLDAHVAWLDEHPSVVGSFLSVVPSLSLHAVRTDASGIVQSLAPVTESGLRVNGGFFVFRQEIFDFMRPGEELVEAPFERLIAARRLVAHRHDGFWMAMDTFKDWVHLDQIARHTPAPWEDAAPADGPT
jgi:glucose-1-phosphate cytidylyltransferase